MTATPSAPPDAVPLEEVVNLSDELIDILPLVQRVSDADVDAGIFADEEIHWMSADADASPDPFIDAPRLGLLPARDQDIALQSAFWMLMAQGAIVRSVDGEPELAGIYAFIGDLRASSEAAASVRIDIRDGGVHRLGLYRVRADLFLCEEVEESSGLHHFTFRSPGRQARWLAAALDAGGHADRTEEPLQAAGIDDLVPHPDTLAEHCHAAGLVTLAERDAVSRGALRAFTAYSGPDGLYVQTGWKAADDGAVAMQRLSPADFAGFCAAFLAAPES